MVYIGHQFFIGDNNVTFLHAKYVFPSTTPFFAVLYILPTGAYVFSDNIESVVLV